MRASIFLIQSHDEGNRSMGSAFAIYQDDKGLYLLTCAHVIEQVVHPKIDEYPVEIIAMGSAQGIDLALLRIPPLEVTPLPLSLAPCASREVQVIGYSLFNRDKYQAKVRQATLLGEPLTLKGINDGSTYRAWQIIAKDHHEIESGNSGSPLICTQGGRVIAVVSNHRGVGEGYAIAIEHLGDIWEGMPEGLLHDDRHLNPFVGLSAFSREQHNLFFGRDKEIEALLSLLAHYDAIAVVGDSGSGKSSLIKAGVIPHLLDRYNVVETRPARHPFHELASSLEQVGRRLGLDFKTLSQIKEAITPHTQAKVVTALEYIFPMPSQLLIYIDQFEELFTLCEKEIQEAFMDLLVYLVEHQTSRLKIKILLTMRRDYYNLLSTHPRFYDLVDAQKYTLHRMQDESLKACITEPLRQTSLTDEEIETFADFVVKDMGDKSSELALLQIALTQMWNHKKEGASLLESYKEVKGVSGALEKLTTDTVKILSEDQKKLLKKIFIRLVKLNEKGGVTRRLADREEFTSEEWSLVQLFASALDEQGQLALQNRAKLGRLLKIRGGEDRDATQSVELSHEALITQWSQYQIWLNQLSNRLKSLHDVVIEKSKRYHHKQERKFLLMGYELDEAGDLLGEEYHELLSDEEIAYIQASQQRRRRTTLLKNSAIIALLMLLGMSLWLYVQARESQAQAEQLNGDLLRVLDKATNGAVVVIQTNNPSYARYTFRFVLEQFLENPDPKVQKIVAKSWFGEARALHKMQKSSKALARYQGLIQHFETTQDPDILLYVAKSHFNRGVLLREQNKTQEALASFNQVIAMESSPHVDKLLPIIAQAWLKKALVEPRKEDQERTFERMIERFKESNNRKVISTLADAYGSWAWLKITQKSYPQSIALVKKGVALKPNQFWMHINLAHAYLLSGQVDKAKQIYLLYRQHKKEIVDDFRLLEEENITTSHFKTIEKIL